MEKLNKLAINKGLLIALISIFLQLIPYYVAPQIINAPWYGILIAIISLLIYIFFTIDLRKQIGGFWTFKQALKGLLIMSLTANVISASFSALFYKFIEKGAYEKMEGYAVASSTKTYEALGMQQQQIDEAMVTVLKQIKAMYDPTLMDFLKTLGILVIVSLILSLIFAAIFKKNPPFTFPETIEE